MQGAYVPTGSPRRPHMPVPASYMETAKVTRPPPGESQLPCPRHYVLGGPRANPCSFQASDFPAYNGESVLGDGWQKPVPAEPLLDSGGEGAGPSPIEQP